MASVACTLPPVSRQSRKLSTVPKASSPLSAAARAPAHVVEQPGDLGGREIGVEQQAGAFGDDRVLVAGARAARRRSRAVRRSCQTMALWIGLPRLAVPDDRGLALIGDADRRDFARHNAGACHRGARSCNRRGPDVGGVMLDMAGCGKNLRKLLLREPDRRQAPVKHKRARRRRPLVNGENVSSQNRLHFLCPPQTSTSTACASACFYLIRAIRWSRFFSSRDPNVIGDRTRCR